MKFFKRSQHGKIKMKHIKIRLSWIILLYCSYSILVLNDIHNLKYIIGFFKEIKKIFEKNSKYIEDGDFILIHKNFIKKI